MFQKAIAAAMALAESLNKVKIDVGGPVTTWNGLARPNTMRHHYSRSKYMPHDGAQSRARRLRQANNGCFTPEQFYNNNLKKAA